MSFWDELPRPFFALAPMEEVTDVVFRSVVARAGRPDVFFTEFMNVNGFCHPDGRASVARRLEISPTDAPIVAQIWGSDPEKFSLTAAEISKMGFSGIDINMGCPDKKVVKSGGGSALIQTPELAVEIIRATKAGTGNGVDLASDPSVSETSYAGQPAEPSSKKTNLSVSSGIYVSDSEGKKSSSRPTPLPISVKTRLGYSKVEEWRKWLTVLLEQNLANLTVHLRTKKEMSKVPAHHELIPEIVALRDKIAPATKLTINGDIADRLQGRNLQEKYSGVDGFMIGRGVFDNPFCFTNITNPSREQLFDLLNYHLDQFDEHEPRKFEPLKRFFKIYVKDFPGAAELRAKLFECKSTDEVRRALVSDFNFGFSI